MKVGHKESETLRSISQGLLGIYSIYDPRIKKTRFYKDAMSDRRSRDVVHQRLKRLEDKELISLGGDKIKLTQKGKKYLEKIDSSEITIIKDAWDGTWRIIAYDIPNDFTRERNFFRDKLKELDFYQVQKSVWAFPYECKEEIAIFAHSLRISPFVIYVKTDKLPNQTKIKNHFNIK